MKKAVFLDRDGVINRPVYHENTGEMEPPHNTSEIIFYDWTVSALLKLMEMEYELFIVSNQPDFAKGKASLEGIQIVCREIESRLLSQGVCLTGSYYCFHHPGGVGNHCSIACQCRKPSPFFVLKAIDEYGINPHLSWFIGDRHTDVQCGINAGLKTILIRQASDEADHSRNRPDFVVDNLNDAVEIIEREIGE